MKIGEEGEEELSFYDDGPLSRGIGETALSDFPLLRTLRVFQILIYLFNTLYFVSRRVMSVEGREGGDGGSEGGREGGFSFRQK